ncbi:GNAT family N-acetyltransferase [Lactiplantibacillus garii]|uniref:GNAT family N-acetyltransferase n=1 Tax=Lactiplantibacillus garii TaxID=2306423 RepID=A0A3R8KGM3_9LACO|nr:GNAT family N-acetyltransferase [Lactiplantibacillus garii]RRK11475.1 GNAT family N-acetyltransferase [Lactiplantibacillus garii]
MEIKKSNQTDSAVYADALMIREAVFIREQGIAPQLELDTVTPATWHYVLYDDQAHAVATARMTPNDDTTQHVQRVATLKTARGHGYAQALLQAMMTDARKRHFSRLVLGAQVTAQSFYAQLGFVPEGPVFMEAGLRHQAMQYTL